MFSNEKTTQQPQKEDLSRNDVIAEYAASPQAMKKEANATLLTYAILPCCWPLLVMYGPCLYAKAKEMKRLSPHLRYYITETGIGSYVTSDYKSSSPYPPSIIEGGLFTLYVGKFFRFSELLRVDVVKTNTKDKLMLHMTLNQLSYNGEHNKHKHKKMNWILPDTVDPYQVKRIIDEKLP